MAAARINVNRIVFIGAGNMAEALVRGMLAARVCTAERLFVTDVRSERLAFFENEFQVKGLSNNEGAVRNADVVVLAVKPQVIGGVLDGFQ